MEALFESDSLGSSHLTMAGANFSPSGFSYAQAAARRGPTVASQTSSSKGASGAATPANSVSLEASSAGNWADDVEESVGGAKDAESQEVKQEESTDSIPKESLVDRTKAEDKLQNGVSGVSSPDPTGSSTTSAATRDDSPSAPTGSSSDLTSDTKSQSSEPAWIAERKERQSIPPSNENTPKSERKGKKNATPPKEEPKPAAPVVLQDAPLPSFNPWQKRAEEAKAKVSVTPKSSPAPASTNPPATTPARKENQAPTAPSQRQAENTTITPQRESVNTNGDTARKPSASQGKRASEVRITGRQDSRSSTNEARPDTPTNSWAKPTENRNSARPPPVKDEVSWPTPDTAQEKERKEASEKQPETPRDDDNTPTAKRKKPDWTKVEVQPTIVWETQSMNEPRERKPRPGAGAERGGRGGTRGRGAYRGGASAVNGGDRQTRSSPPPVREGEQASRGRPNGAGGDAAVSKQAQNGDVAGSNEQKAGSVEQNSIAGEKTVKTNGAPALNSEKSSFGASETTRARSPKKATARGADTDEVATPVPIPRRVSLGTQTDGVDAKSRGEPPVRMVPTDGRKESRSYDTMRESNWNAGSRGNKRSGRGRGGNGAGSRDPNNGLPSGFWPFRGDLDTGTNPPPYNNGPQSTSGYARGNYYQFTHPPPGPSRGGWPRGNPRAHSIPVDNMYRGYAPQQYGPHMPNYMPGMYEFMPQPPMSAVASSPQEAHESLLQMVMAQVQYYFSTENLCHDMFLRKNMDSQGFVFIDVVANFNRMKQLTSDKDVLKIACLNSGSIEIRMGDDGKERLRKREGWESFVCAMEDRVEAARTEGPQRLEVPDRPQLSMPNGPHYQGPHSAGLPPMHQQFDPRRSLPMMNGFAPQFVPNGGYHETIQGHTNGEEMRGRFTKSPVYENGAGFPDRTLPSAVDGQSAEQDAFPDDQISALGIVVRTSEQQPPYHSAASRTFSNGSIDSRSIAAEMDKTPANDGHKLTNGDSHTSSGKERSLSRHLSPNKARSPGQGQSDQDKEISWAKDVNDIPAGTTYEAYNDIRAKALQQRDHAATGNCPYDLDVLYQFWCHFLCRNFNNSMYSEFMHHAQEDARARHSTTGINNLLKFYAHSLNSFDPIRPRIVKDYVELVKNEPPILEGAAFKQLRSAWRNGALNLKNRKRLADIVGEQLKEALDKSEA